MTRVSWRVGLLPVRAFDGEGNASSADIAAGLAYAARMGVRVVNGSFGARRHSQAVEDAITSNPQTLFVFAAGNGEGFRQGTNNGRNPMWPCVTPAANVVCVAASDPWDRRLDWSNFGRESVDLAAPGTSLLSTERTGYMRARGTSMAAPHVAGTAALLWARRPNATVLQVRHALRRGVDHRPWLARRTAWGGRVNADRALRALLP